MTIHLELIAPQQVAEKNHLGRELNEIPWRSNYAPPMMKFAASLPTQSMHIIRPQSPLTMS